ncbi:MAG: ribonuclease III [Anaerolineales bacterium]|nr:ribonuclease III [Anaerolineales bacterium]
MSLEDFARQAGLPMRDLTLLQSALTHRSFVNEHSDAREDNERLEFLGDAALDFLSAALLFRRFPNTDEGKLTRIRSALVCTEQLAAFAQEIGLGEVLLLGKGEEASGGRQRPALLCGAFEAVLGALYMDSGLQAVERFLELRLDRAVTAIVEEEAEFDPRSQLQIWAQAEHRETPRYRTVGSSGPDHDRLFRVQVSIGDSVMAEGSGKSKQEAARQAAVVALRGLGQGPAF